MIYFRTLIKNYILMKLILQKLTNRIVLFIFLFMSFLSVTGQVTLPHYEGLDYTDGASLQTQTNWSTLNTGDNLAITLGSLSYSGLPTSTGNKVAFAGAGIDAAKAFTSQTTGTVYYSFILNITSVTGQTASSYITSFTDTSTGFGATVWTRADGEGFDLGLSPRTAIANTVYTDGTLPLNTPIFVVISYEFVAGASNDIVKLWINPALGSTEPAVTLSATNTGTDLASVNRILIRQGGASDTPFVEMDELRIGTTWDSVTPSASAGTISSAGTSFPLTTLTTTYGTASSSTEFIVSGTGLTAGITVTPPVGFEVSLTSDNFGATIGTNASPLIVGAAGIVNATSCQVRLSSTATFATNVTGNIVLTSSGVSTVNVPLNATNSVSKKELYINGITADDKEFDTTTDATLSGILTATFTGIVNGDTPNVILDGSAYVANFDTPNVGINKPVTVSGFTITGSKAFCYNLNQPTGLTANITPTTLQTQTITFDALTPVTYGVSPITLNATTTSPLQVTYTLSPPTGIATLSGNILTIVGAGTLTITASQAGNGTYLPASDVIQNLLVNPKDVTILNPSASDKLYDGTTTATINGTLDGVISPDVVTLNLSGNFDTPNVGTNKLVTSNSTITNTDAYKYNLVQPLNLTAAILLAPCNATPGVVTWDFTTADPSSNTTSGTLVSSLTQGNNNGTTTLITSTSASNNVGASGTNNAGAAARVGALDTTPTTGSAYFEFTLTPPTGYSLSLTGLNFGSRRTATGPQSYSLRSDLDGYTSDVATGSFTAASTWVLHTPTLVSTTNVNPTITYRLYGHSGAGSPVSGTANWRIDDLKLNLSETLLSPLTSAISATTCSGSAFNYTPTTNLPGTTITWKRAAVVGISNPAVTTPQASTVSETLINTTNASIDVVYEFTISNGNCFFIQNVTVTVNNCSSVVNLKLFIEGYYLGGGLMTTVQNNQDAPDYLLPANTNVETITLELRDATTTALVTSANAMLQTNGDATFTFPTAPSGSFYLAVKTRTTVQTWSSLPQAVGALPLSYDFTTAATQAYFDNQAALGGGVFGFFSGDIDSNGAQDGEINASDYSEWEADSNALLFGSYATDLNGDGEVNATDYSIWETNANGFVFALYPTAP